MASVSQSSLGEGSMTRRVLPAYVPTVLTWNPNELYDDDNEPSGPAAQEPEATRPRTPITLPNEPLEPPPTYDIARIPATSVTYSFSSLGPSSSAMIVVPPFDSPDTRPVYHISVGQDPFFPNCSITSVVEGGTGQGLLVGHFKTVTGIDLPRKDRDLETVCIRECEHPLRTMFVGSSVKRQGVRLTNFSWYSVNTKRALSWKCSTTWPLASPSTCTHASAPKTILATFTPVNELQRRDRPITETQLTITPAGHPHFDDILISALILERHRRLEFCHGR